MKSNPSRLLRVVFIATVAIALAGPQASQAQTAQKPVTFTKDVAPIFQQKCEACHRPDSIAPMSLRTYEEIRPLARSIRSRVETRQMPPWHIDKTVGIQQFKNDRSLSDDQIATILAWVDQGAVEGRTERHAATQRVAGRAGLELHRAVRTEGTGPDHPQSAMDEKGRTGKHLVQASGRNRRHRASMGARD